MHPLATRRFAAYGLDCVTYLGIAAATVPFGILAQRAGWGESQAFVVSASAVPVVAATLVAARFESRRGATWGKRRLGIAVRPVESEAGAIPFGRTLARNVAKIAVPWQLGHVVTIGAMFGGFDRPDPLLVAAGAAVYAVIGVGVWGVLRRSGVGVPDMLAGTRVGLAAV